MIDPIRLETAVDTGLGYPWHLLHDDRSKLLIEAGVVAEITPQNSMVCPDCCITHPVHQNGSGEFELACEAGRRIIDRNELRRWRIRMPTFALWLSGMLSERALADQRVPDVLWYLGDTNLMGGECPVWFARRCEQVENVDAIKGSFERRSPVGPGILISSSAAAEVVSWPKETQTLRLADVLMATKDGWGLSIKQLRARAPSACKKSGAIGAPSKNDFDNVGVFLLRVMNGEAQKVSLAAEAEDLRDLQLQQFAADDCHSIGTIKNAIRSEYSAWRESGFSKLPDAT